MLTVAAPGVLPEPNWRVAAMLAAAGTVRLPSNRSVAEAWTPPNEAFHVTAPLLARVDPEGTVITLAASTTQVPFVVTFAAASIVNTPTLVAAFMVMVELSDMETVPALLKPVALLTPLTLK